MLSAAWTEHQVKLEGLHRVMGWLDQFDIVPRLRANLALAYCTKQSGLNFDVQPPDDKRWLECLRWSRIPPLAFDPPKAGEEQMTA